MNSSVLISNLSYIIDENLTTTNNDNEVSLAIDYNTYFLIRIVFSWLSFAIILVGLCGNFVSFLILISPRMRISTNVFLANLCVASFIALAGLLINSVFYDLVFYYGFSFLILLIQRFYPFVYPIITTFQIASIFLTICVSVNQFICIYSSKANNNQNNKKLIQNQCKKALIIVLFVYIFSIIYCLPYWFKFRFTQEEKLHETEISKHPKYNSIVHFWLYLPICYIIPITILIITNSYLLSKLMLAKKRRKRLGINSSVKLNSKSSNANNSAIFVTASKFKNNKNNDDIAMKNIEKEVAEKKELLAKEELNKNNNMDSKITYNDNNNKNNHENLTNFNNKKFLKATKDEHSNSIQSIRRRRTISNSRSQKRIGGSNITIMLIAIVFFFFICQLPTLILHIIQSMECSNKSQKCQNTPFTLYSQILSKFLLIINLSFNFVFYCLFSEKYRTVLKEKLPSIFKKSK